MRSVGKVPAIPVEELSSWGSSSTSSAKAEADDGGGGGMMRHSRGMMDLSKFLSSDEEEDKDQKAAKKENIYQEVTPEAEAPEPRPSPSKRATVLQRKSEEDEELSEWSDEGTNLPSNEEEQEKKEDRGQIKAKLENIFGSGKGNLPNWATREGQGLSPKKVVPEQTSPASKEESGPRKPDSDWSEPPSLTQAVPTSADRKSGGSLDRADDGGDRPAIAPKPRLVRQPKSQTRDNDGTLPETQQRGDAANSGDKEEEGDKKISTLAPPSGGGASVVRRNSSNLSRRKKRKSSRSSRSRSSALSKEKEEESGSSTSQDEKEEEEEDDRRKAAARSSSTLRKKKKAPTTPTPSKKQEEKSPKGQDEAKKGVVTASATPKRQSSADSPRSREEAVRSLKKQDTVSSTPKTPKEVVDRAKEVFINRLDQEERRKRSVATMSRAASVAVEPTPGMLTDEVMGEKKKSKD